MVVTELREFNKGSGAWTLAKEFVKASRKIMKAYTELEKQGRLKYATVHERTLEVDLMKTLPKTLTESVCANQQRDHKQTIADITVRSSNKVKGGMVIELKKADGIKSSHETQVKKYMRFKPKYKYGMLLVFPKKTPAQRVMVRYYRSD